MSIFGDTYAAVYDELYSSKDYSKECDMIEALLALHGCAERKLHLLDLGCGTGNHAIPLARRGHTVTGVDISEAMLAHAREKAFAAGVSTKTSFHQGDIRSVELPGMPCFDAAIMMFAVLGYQQCDADVRDTLMTVRRHLPPDASLIFDVWYGPGVLADRPAPRERIIERGSERIVRRASAMLDEQRHLCTVCFDLEIFQNSKLTTKTREQHTVRFFFLDELQRLSNKCGFVLTTLRDFSVWQEPVAPSSWNAVGVLHAV